MPTLIELNRRFCNVREIPIERLPDLGDHYRLFSDKLLGWPEVQKQRLTVILGEARSGKTSEFHLRKEELSRNGAFAIGLRVENAADRGIRLTRPQQDRFNFWLGTSEPGYIFLDALDEAQLRHYTIRDAIMSVERLVPESHLPHLHLFISARATDWTPSDLSPLVGLAGRMGITGSPEQAVSVLLVAPLVQEQVRLLAAAWGVQNVPTFLEAVAAVGVERFAGHCNCLS